MPLLVLRRSANMSNPFAFFALLAVKNVFVFFSLSSFCGYDVFDFQVSLTDFPPHA